MNKYNQTQNFYSIYSIFTCVYLRRSLARPKSHNKQQVAFFFFSNLESQKQNWANIVYLSTYWLFGLF